MSVYLSARHAARLVGTLAALNVVFLVGTAAAVVGYRQLLDLPPGSRGVVQFGLAQLNLGAENVLAAWYSSMLLLLVAGAAVVCWFADRSREDRASRRRLSVGWLVLAVVFAGLSLDEMGAIHERIGTSRAADGSAPGWVVVLAIPIALVASYMLVFAWTRLRREPLVAMLLVAGVALFLSVPFQEEVEVAILTATAAGTAERPVVGTLLEEGSEIFGSLCFLGAMLLYALRTALPDPTDPGRSVRRVPAELSVRAATRAALVVAGAFATVLAFAVATSPARQTYSRDALWVALFFTAAIDNYDADLAVAFAADDVVLRLAPPPPGENGVYAGKEALRGWIRQSQAQHLRFERDEQHSDGGTTTWRGTAVTDELRAAGVRSTPTTTSVEVAGGKVRALAIDFNPPLTEQAVVMENWFVSAPAAVAAAICALLLAARRRLPDLGRLPLLGTALLSLTVSAYFGANAPAYNDWGQLDLLRQGLRALMAGAVIALGLQWAVWTPDRLTQVSLTIWAVLLTAGLWMEPTPAGAASAAVAYAVLVPAIARRVWVPTLSRAGASGDVVLRAPGAHLPSAT